MPAYTYMIFDNLNSHHISSANTSDWSAVREGTTTLTLTPMTTNSLSVRAKMVSLGPPATYGTGQGFVQFNTSLVQGTPTSTKIMVKPGSSQGSNANITHVVCKSNWTTQTTSNFVPGSQLSSLVEFGRVTKAIGTLGTTYFPIVKNTPDIDITSTYSLIVYDDRQLSATATTIGDEWAWSVRFLADYPGYNVYLLVDVDETNYWTPANLPGLQLWIDPSDYTTRTSGSQFVFTMADKSGLGNNFANTSSAGTGWDGINGHSALQNRNYTVVSGWYKFAPTGNGLDSINNGDNTYATFARVSNTAISNTQVAFGSGVSTSAATIGARTGTANGVWCFRHGTTTTNSTVTSNTAITVQTRTGTSLKGYVNGTLAVSNSTAVNFSQTKGHRIGGPDTPAYLLQGFIGDCIICNQVISDEDRQKLEGYLAYKWGEQASLPSDHPYKSSPPTLSGGGGVSRRASRLSSWL